MTKTYFLQDEKTFWHTTRDAVLVFPPIGNLQPLTALGHVENAETKRRFLSLVHVTGLMDELTSAKSKSITREQAEIIHDKKYLDHLQHISEGTGGDAGFAASCGHKTYEYAMISAGLAVDALQLVLDNPKANSYALTRPPGHHCLAEEAMGFCYMANIPLAIEIAKQKNPDLRIAVVDWDVHHGNGTQNILYDRDDVLKISLHQVDCFPRDSGHATDYGTGKGEGYNMNIPLPPGTGDGGYVYALEKMVVPALEKFNPDAIIVASGYDPGMTDPLGRMMMTSPGFVAMTNIIKSASEKLNAPIMMTHEGGYCSAYSPILAYKTLEALAGSSINMEDDFLIGWEGQAGTELQPLQKKLVDDLISAHPFLK